LLPGFSTSFLEVYARRLFMAIAPDSKLRFQTLEEHEVISGLIGAGTSLDLGLGVADTVHRRFLGLEFLAFPGWQVRLAAVTIRRSQDTRRPPTWQAATSQTGFNDHFFLVLGDDLAGYFLGGQCGIPAERLLVRNASDPAEIAKMLFHEAGLHPYHWILLITDEQTSRRVVDALQRVEGFAEGYAVEELEASPGDYPAYALSLALGPGTQAWRHLLEAAAGQEIFGSSLRQTAQLYAAVMTAGLFEHGSFDMLDPARTRPVAKLTAFDQATPEFKEMLCRDLVDNLSRELVSRLESAGLSTEAGAIPGGIEHLAPAYAQRLIPEAWAPRLNAVLGREVRAGSIEQADETEQVGPSLAHHCQSCSVSLSLEHNRGTSERYCRFCSDERGRLKPRPEVEHLIADWFEYWQGDISQDEAMRRAKLFMQAMPAWCNN
jgi:hypothetical protein